MPDSIFQIIKTKALTHLHWCHCPFLKKQGNLHQKFQLAKSKKFKEKQQRYVYSLPHQKDTEGVLCSTGTGTDPDTDYL